MSECTVCGEVFDSERSMKIHRGQIHDLPWHDEEVLREEYEERGKSIMMLAEMWDITHKNVSDWLKKHGIETRERGEQQVSHRWEGVKVRQTHGYEVAYTTVDQSQSTVRIHQLVAIAEGEDPYKVFSDKKHHVHHKNGIPWDNRAENLELMTAQEHGLHHNRKDEEKA
jgi:hypothetical protein